MYKLQNSELLLVIEPRLYLDILLLGKFDGCALAEPCRAGRQPPETLEDVAARPPEPSLHYGIRARRGHFSWS